jgi:predicted nucleic acid-binding protein
MADYLLDTNHLSPLVTLSHPLRQRVLAALQAEHTFAITVPVLVEMSNFDCYIPDESDAQQAADLQIQLRRQGWQLATVDALVAAVALRHNLTLLTRDKDFMAISSLKQETWLES